jgi:hypothetical protein
MNPTGNDTVCMLLATVQLFSPWLVKESGGAGDGDEQTEGSAVGQRKPSGGSTG